MDHMNKNTGILVLKKSLSILEYLSEFSGWVSLRDIAAGTGLNKSAVFRILDTFATEGYIVRNQEGQYQLGYKWLSISRNQLNSDLLQVTRPYMEDLSKKLDMIVHLVVRDGDEGVYVDKVDLSSRSIRLFSKIGARLKLHSTAAGKVLLANLPDTELSAFMDQATLTPRTPFTIVDKNVLWRDLYKVRAMNYAIDDMEDAENIRCIAAPIKGFQGICKASISVSSPIIYMRLEDVEQLASEIIQCAKQISMLLGCSSAEY